MIRYLEGVTYENVLNKCEDIISFCERGGIGVNALGPFLSYGTSFDFLDAWVQYDETGRITAFITKFYSSVTVFTGNCSLDSSFYDEIREFLDVIGFTSVISDSPFVFQNGASKIGCVMGLKKSGYCKASETEDRYLIKDGESFELIDYRNFFSVLMKNNPGYIGTSEDDFVLDFSHRTRHEKSCPVMLCVSDEIVSTAAAMSVAPHSVFLGAVSTNENCRGKHYAFTLIKYLCEKYNDKSIYLRCETSKRAFYEKAGLQFLGEFYA